MGQRQEGERLIVLAEVVEPLAAEYVRDEVPVRQDDALGVTGGARGVDDARRVVAPDPPVEGLEIRVRGRRRVADQGFEVRATRRGGIGVQRDQPQALLLRPVLARAFGGEAGQQIPFRVVVVEDPPGPAVEEDVGDLSRGQGRIDRHRHRAQEVAREVDHVPLRPVGREQGHAIALGHAVGLERQGGAADRVDEPGG